MPDNAPDMPRSCLYVGHVMHQRLIPFRHGFRYRVFGMLINLGEVEALQKKLRFFSWGRFNLFSIKNKNHAARDGSDVKPWVMDHLKQHNITADTIYMFCMPRMWGYVFNPLTIYYAYDNGRPSGIVYQVKNTFGGQHAYVTALEADTGKNDLKCHSHRKEFYVSPFIPVEGGYDFRMKSPGERLSIFIRHHVSDGDILIATQTGKRIELSDKNILKLCVTYPFLVFKVVAGIHWEALKLWVKGAKFHSHRAYIKQKKSKKI